jgi:hypothetical protein
MIRVQSVEHGITRTICTWNNCYLLLNLTNSSLKKGKFLLNNTEDLVVTQALKTLLKIVSEQNSRIEKLENLVETLVKLENSKSKLDELRKISSCG